MAYVEFAPAMRNRRLPAPQAQAFVICREVRHDTQTGEIVLVGPVSHIPIPQFPADIRLSVYAHVTGGHGTYPLAFILRAADGDTVWRRDAGARCTSRPAHGGPVLL